ncbi:hypothetical protein QWY14_12550 [Planococcus sp. N028]|uniref:Uncharacterized protein n=1 Tax=Planococcus shixiaomingii TaxID=3058393 RepID=A0ABT8N426_9BACL|nr:MULTISPECIES: hypothetical protein [unclassified Planococcus (in: firmicutes)]MDN7242636.1 hypothetical protein [Planococcus sp. N028]WKA55731.1 hypothetical protein QWY21_04900 [Planococcus sp. N022]
MNKTKIHPLILLSLGISSFVMGWRGYENFTLHKDGYGMTFSFLCIFLALLAVYALMRNQRIESFNRRNKKGHKLIR